MGEEKEVEKDIKFSFLKDRQLHQLKHHHRYYSVSGSFTVLCVLWGNPNNSFNSVLYLMVNLSILNRSSSFIIR